MAVLDVWVANPTNASRMDDEAWRITLYDALSQVFVWAGTTYADMPAPNAHWTGTIPPGTYVVSGRGETNGLATDHAIVSFDGGEAITVRLYVHRDSGGGTHDCSVKVTDAVGLRGRNTDLAQAVRASGTAAGCSEVVVTVVYEGTKEQVTATVQADGSWSVDVPMKGGVRCGGSLAVVAQCAKDKRCADRLSVAELKCAATRKTSAR
ncbi:MAG: hypothetical protein QOC82_1860 [Frankiaceae bacterium]|jgi:hypothetical protein|nr:hypothetical protein [Frankiaceae bacterium]